MLWFWGKTTSWNQMHQLLTVLTSFYTEDRKVFCPQSTGIKPSISATFWSIYSPNCHRHACLLVAVFFIAVCLYWNQIRLEEMNPQRVEGFFLFVLFFWSGYILECSAAVLAVRAQGGKDVRVKENQRFRSWTQTMLPPFILINLGRR